MIREKKIPKFFAYKQKVRKYIFLFDSNEFTEFILFESSTKLLLLSGATTGVSAIVKLSLIKTKNV